MAKKLSQKDKEVLSKVGETIVEKQTDIKIPILPRNIFHAWLQKHGLSATKKIFIIQPQKVDTIYRIASRSIKFNTGNLFKTTDVIGTIMDIMARHRDDIVYIVACILQNNTKEPKRKTLRLVNTLEIEDIHEILQIGVSNYNINSFSKSIILVVGVDALEIKDEKVSPKENES